MSLLKLCHSLNISRTQSLTTNSYNLFYQNLTSLYTQHQYRPNRIWNCDETGIQARRQLGAKVIAKKGFLQMYNIIPKSKEWLTINYVVNVTRGSILGFYIFRGERIRGDYIMHCKLGTCMAS